MSTGSSDSCGLGARIFELSKATFLRRPPSAPPDLEALRALRHFRWRHAGATITRRWPPLPEARICGNWLRSLPDYVRVVAIPQSRDGLLVIPTSNSPLAGGTRKADCIESSRASRDSHGVGSGSAYFRPGRAAYSIVPDVWRAWK